MNTLTGFRFVASEHPSADEGLRYAWWDAVYSRAASKHPLWENYCDQGLSERHVIIARLNEVGEKEPGGRVRPEYLPDEVGEILTVSNASGDEITLELREKDSLPGNIVRKTVLVRKGSEDEDPMTVHSLHKTDWREYTVPADDDLSLLILTDEILKTQRQFGGPGQCEVWMHCAGGVGRTGTQGVILSLYTTVEGTDNVRTEDEADGNPLPMVEGVEEDPIPEEFKDDPVWNLIDTQRHFKRKMVGGDNESSKQLEYLYGVRDSWFPSESRLEQVLSPLGRTPYATASSEGD